MALTVLRRFIRKGRSFEPTWRYLFNFAPTVSYRMKRPLIEGEQARVLGDLNRNGIAITSARALFGEDRCFDELCQSFDELRRSVKDKLARAQEKAASCEEIGAKSFIFEYLGQNPVLNPHEVYARFALHETILRTANAYLGMHTRLRYYNIWHTFASRAAARESQLWHRDREDMYIFKVFAYLNDVGEEAGPFTYAPGSHGKGSIHRQPEYFLEDGVKRSGDQQMARIIPPEKWIKAIGPKGTIVFADTRGYHKGGLAREQDRLMYTCMFTSPASESREFLKRSADLSRPQDKALAFALAAPKRGAWLNWKPEGYSLP